MNNLLFSVIIPSHNRAHILPQAINAVLNQSYSSWELLIVDDGSTDDTKDIVTPLLKDTRIKYFYQQNAGVCAARNTGAKQAKGNYLIFLDSDDAVEKTWLEDFNSLHEENFDLLFCNMKFIKNDGNVEWRLSSDPYKNGKVKGLGIPGAWAVKRDVFFSAGMYDDKIKFAENTELRFRLDMLGVNIGIVDKFNFIYFESSDGGSKNIDNKFDSCLYIIKKHPGIFNNSHKNRFVYFNIIAVNGIILGKYKIAFQYLLKALKMRPFYLKNYFRVIKLVYRYSITKSLSLLYKLRNKNLKNMIDIIFGTRPEAIKLAILVKLCRAHFPGKVRVISTGQHKEMLEQVLEWFEIQPDYDLNIMTSNQSLAGMTSVCLEKLDQFYNQNSKPNLLIVQGDTSTAFTSALAAFYHKIPVAHVEAGLRTHDKWSPFPEEINRKLIGQIADLHFAPTNMAQEVLLDEKVAGSKVFMTGNTVIDALLYSKNKIDEQNYFPPHLEEYYTGTKSEGKIVLITGHRRENFGQGFQDICMAIKTLSQKYQGVTFIYPVHLNPNVKDVVFELLGDLPNVALIAPMSYPDFISMMDRSYFILTDSGGVQEEAPSFGKPVLIMRNNTERKEGVDAGVVKLIGTHVDQIVNESSRLLEDKEYYNSFLKNQNPYGNGDSSEQIIKLIGSYV